MIHLFKVFGFLIALISTLIAVWSFFFMFNSSVGDALFHDNMYGLLCVACCLSTIVIAWLTWKGYRTLSRRWYKYALILAIAEVATSLWYSIDYPNHNNRWYDTVIDSDLGPLPAKCEYFEVGPDFMQSFLFGYGYVDLFLMSFLGYGIAFLLSLFLTKKRVLGATVWNGLLID